MPERAVLGQATCTRCSADYNAADPDAVKLHTEPVSCSCGRCDGKPRCYPCGGSFCKCGVH